MTLVKYRPASKRSAFDDLFDGFFNFPISQTIGSDSAVNQSPRVNVKTNEKEFIIEMLTPGFEKKDISIELEENVLSISANKDEKKTKVEDKYTRKEFSLKSFSRKFTLPEDIKDDGIKASSKNGLLVVSIPKAEKPAKISKRISIG